MQRSKLLRGLPLLLIILFVGCTVLLHMDCAIITGNWGDAYFECKNDSLFRKNSMFTKKRHFTVTYLYSIYVVTSLVTGCNLQGFHIEAYFDVLYVTICSMGGLIVRMMIYSFIALHYYGKNRANTITDIDHANQIEIFMKSEQLSNSLKNAVMNHYDSVRLMPLSIHKASGYMLMSIRRDALFENFGPNIVAANFLNGVTNANVFLRNILPHMTRLYVNKGLYLLRVNDVVSNIWLVFEGVVNVIAPDDRTHVTHLGTGSLIGNLYDTKYSRIQHMFLAETMLETYAIPSDIFYHHLVYFADVKSTYNKLKYVFRHFIKTNKVDSSLLAAVPAKLHTADNIIRSCHNRWMSLVIAANERWFITFTIFSIVVVYLDILALISISPKMEYMWLYAGTTTLYAVNLVLLPKVDFKPYSCKLVHQPTNISPRKHWCMYLFCAIGAMPFQSLQSLWVDRLATSAAEAFVIASGCCNIKLVRLLWMRCIIDNYAGIMGIRIYMYRHLMNAAIFLLLIILTADLIILAGALVTPNMNPPVQFNSSNSFNEQIKFAMVWMEFAVDILTHNTQYNFYPVTPVFMLICTTIMFVLLVASVFFIVDIVFTQLECQLRKVLDAQKLFKLQHFMQSWEVNEYMVERVVRYCNERYICEANLKTPPPILHTAPLQLKMSLMDACYGELLEINPVFSHCHIHFIRQLSQYFEPFCYYPEDYIQYQGCMEATMYFVHRGVVEELSEHDRAGCKRHRYIAKAQTFGELQGCNIRIPLRHSYRAVTPSIVLSLQYSSWSHMLDLFPASRAIIHMQINKFLRVHKADPYTDITI